MLACDAVIKTEVRMSREIKENEMKWGTMPLKRWARKRKSVSGKWRSGRNRGKRTECIHKEIKEENISKMFLFRLLIFSDHLFYFTSVTHPMTLSWISFIMKESLWQLKCQAQDLCPLLLVSPLPLGCVVCGMSTNPPPRWGIQSTAPTSLSTSYLPSKPQPF